MISLETAIKLKEAGLEWEPKVGDIVSAIWDPNGSTGGLQKCVLQERPIYGLSWENGEWLYCNGIINNTPFVTPLKSNKDFKGVALFPRLDQLLMEIEKRDWTWMLYAPNSEGKYGIDVDKGSIYHNNKTIMADSPGEAAAQALLWILEQEAIARQTAHTAAVKFRRKALRCERREIVISTSLVLIKRWMSGCA